MKSKVLTMLKEGDTYVSGQKMCEELSVSRTAVWKAIRQLKEEGYEIESVTNKGYHLVSIPNLVTREEILEKIKTRFIAKQVYYQEEVDSTNTVAKRLAEEVASDGLLVTSDLQTGGKGRRGRSWDSKKGSGIFMSLILKPELEPMYASMLTLVAALCVAKGILELTGLSAQIKWPNDIVVNKKKVCGILTEMNAELDFIHYVIIGIGINVNTKEFPDEISHMATSLYLETRKELNRSALICLVMEQMEVYYERFLEYRSMAPFLEEYNALLVNQGQQVKIINNKEEMVGISKGINEKGELLVETTQGEIAVMSGEVSVRGMYGYV
ncbi:MAG: BirA family transcriptional regulator [Clostridiales bacterium]|nr:BirA family transcriptional regulator [Clostridiales bacterium]